MGGVSRTRERRMAVGVCRMCGNPSVKEGTRSCEGCLLKARQKYYQKRDETPKPDYNPEVCSRCCDAKSNDGYRWCPRCRYESHKYYKQRRHAGKCGFCGGNPYGKALCDECSSATKRRHTQYRKRDKDEVFENYGGYVCACCGETEPLFLEIDHINNDGAEDRERMGLGSDFYSRVRRLGFPSGLQVLCTNCNRGKARNGGVCPHKTDKFAQLLSTFLIDLIPGIESIDARHEWSNSA